MIYSTKQTFVVKYTVFEYCMKKDEELTEYKQIFLIMQKLLNKHIIDKQFTYITVTWIIPIEYKA